MTDWWKKPSVPYQHKLFAAAYRWGYEEGATSKPVRSRNNFSNEEAEAAYKSGHEAGKAKALERTEAPDD